MCCASFEAAAADGRLLWVRAQQLHIAAHWPGHNCGASAAVAPAQDKFDPRRVLDSSATKGCPAAIAAVAAAVVACVGAVESSRFGSPAARSDPVSEASLDHSVAAAAGASAAVVAVAAGAAVATAAAAGPMPAPPCAHNPVAV